MNGRSVWILQTNRIPKRKVSILFKERFRESEAIFTIRFYKHSSFDKYWYVDALPKRMHGSINNHTNVVNFFPSVKHVLFVVQVVIYPLSGITSTLRRNISSYKFVRKCTCEEWQYNVWTVVYYNSSEHAAEIISDHQRMYTPILFGLVVGKSGALFIISVISATRTELWSM